MKRCPKCKRFGVEYNSSIGTEKCLWDDCLWVNETNINIKDIKFKNNFAKFKEVVRVALCGKWINQTEVKV